MLPLLEAWIQSLVRELRSYESHGEVKKKLKLNLKEKKKKLVVY